LAVVKQPRWRQGYKDLSLNDFFFGMVYSVLATSKEEVLSKDLRYNYKMNNITKIASQ